MNGKLCPICGEKVASFFSHDRERGWYFSCADCGPYDYWLDIDDYYLRSEEWQKHLSHKRWYSADLFGHMLKDYEQKSEGVTLQ